MRCCDVPWSPLAVLCLEGTATYLCGQGSLLAVWFSCLLCIPAPWLNSGAHTGPSQITLPLILGSHSARVGSGGKDENSTPTCRWWEFRADVRTLLMSSSSRFCHVLSYLPHSTLGNPAPSGIWKTFLFNIYLKIFPEGMQWAENIRAGSFGDAETKSKSAQGDEDCDNFQKIRTRCVCCGEQDEDRDGGGSKRLWQKSHWETLTEPTWRGPGGLPREDSNWAKKKAA